MQIRQRAAALAFVVKEYSWVFSKRIKGKVLDVQRVTNPEAIFSSNVTDAQIHSYSVLIQGEDGKLYTSSSEDRQWQVASKGYCVEALLYRYPPWNLQKANSFFNARIIELSLCDGKPPEKLPPPVAADTPPGEGSQAPQPVPSTNPANH